jgi:hypothetical protein
LKILQLKELLNNTINASLSGSEGREVVLYNNNKGVTSESLSFNENLFNDKW